MNYIVWLFNVYSQLSLVITLSYGGHAELICVVEDYPPAPIRDVRKPNFCSVSVFKNPNRSQKVKPEISVSVVFLKTELVSYK